MKRKGFNLTALKQKKSIINQLPEPEQEEPLYGMDRHNAIAVDKFLKEVLRGIQEETAGQYVQGQDKCPICGGVVNYTWSQFAGFSVYECSENDCLPFPDGGAKRRRENGEPKLVAARYRK